MLAQLGLNFGAYGLNLASMLMVFGSIFAPCWRYVGPFGRKKLGGEGLVGLREASGIKSGGPEEALAATAHADQTDDLKELPC